MNFATFMNIGLLKLDLFLKGIQPVAGWPENLHLVLPENTWVAVTEDASSPYRITKTQNNEYRLVKDSEDPQNNLPLDLKVKVIFPPKSAEKRLASGHQVSEIWQVHGAFIASVPRGPCRFARSGFACKYCGTKEKMQPKTLTNADFIEALRLLLEENPAEMVHLSSGFVESQDGGILELEALIEEIRKQFNLLIAVDVMPPANVDWIARTYAAGVDMVYYDLDVFDPTLFAATYPEKEQKIRQDRYLKSLEQAVKIFPKGAVASHLLLGLEPIESTLKGIDFLTNLGVVPLVVFFPPQKGTELEKRWKPHLEELIPVYAYLYDKITEKKLSTNWIRQIDVVLTPLEGRHFAGGKSRWQVALKNFYHTSVGRKAAYGLSALRRKLRVKEVKE